MSEDTSKPSARTSAPASLNARFSVEAQPGIVISADRAISSALIVNELVSNAAKHAYQGHGAGRVWVGVATTSVDNFSIAVRDEGGGLPEGFEFGKGKGLGARMVRSLAEQLNASLDIVARHPGRRVHSHRAARPIDARLLCFRVAVEAIEQLLKPIWNGLGGHGIIDRLQLVGDISVGIFGRGADRRCAGRGAFFLPFFAVFPEFSPALPNLQASLSGRGQRIVPYDAHRIRHEKPPPHKRST